MTDRGHVDPNLVGPPCLKLTGNEACWAEAFLNLPMGRGVASAIPAQDRHFFPIARIAADRGDNLARARFEAPPNQRPIFALERAGAAMISEEFGQAPMGGVRPVDDQT